MEARPPIEPGAVCIIIGDAPGFEPNIGTMVTAVGQMRCGCWAFRDASRPVIYVVNRHSNIPMHWCTSTDDAKHQLRQRGIFDVHGVSYPARWLLPIKGEGLGEADETETPKEIARVE